MTPAEELEMDLLHLEMCSLFCGLEGAQDARGGV